MTLGLVLGDQDRSTLGVPVPDSVSDRLLTLLVNDTLPAAAPGEPEMGLKVTVYA